MKIKLSKKTKTFLWVATALATSTAVTTLLTSCSTVNQTIIDDMGGWDKEYGINDATYVRMEEDFKALYESQLDDKKIAGEIDDATYNLQLTTFQNKLNSLHTSLYNSNEYKTLSYTIKTNVLREYARNNYGIRLSRQSNVSLPVAISGIKSSIIDSVLLLCKEYKITDTDTYRKNAETEFDKLYKEAIAEYGEDDVVSVIQYIQNGMVSCFANINKELDCLATQQQLKDFIGKYEINVKEDIAENYHWDKLFSKYGRGHIEISTEDFNNIFTMTYEETDPQSSSSSYFSTSKKTVEFKDDMITGYTLKPILVEMKSDAYTNTYSIDVDYTLVNNNYKDTDDVAKLTAHSSCLKDKSVYDDENITIYDLNANESEREYTNYVLPITEDYEEQQIKATYFNNENFKFTWSTSEEYGYDDFWTEPNEKGEYKSKLDVSDLATSGMMINGKLLSDILTKAGKISLSGGSNSLTGKTKTSGNDSHPWKLTIDNEEVDKNAIQWKLISPTNEKLPDTISISDGVVSWTDKIESKTYNFSVLAIYKETKIQSPLITLTISSSEQSENVENFNNTIKNTLYDENTIDQKLLDFVKNVDFSLDYTENDYSADKDGKKGEIIVNDIIIGYKNSKNTFNVSDLTTKEAISKAINNDSGITKHFSNNLYKSIKSNYLSVSLDLDISKESTNKYVDETSKDMDNLKTGIHVASTVFAVANAIVFGVLLFYLFRKHGESSKIKKAVFLLISIVGLIAIAVSNCLLLIKELNINSDKIEKIENLKKQWDTPAEGSDEFFKKISDDQKYFVSNSDEAAEKCKNEFDKLSISKVKEKKWFYEQCQNKPADYEKNPDKYKDTPYGMFKNSEKKFDEVNSIVVDVSWRFNTVIITDCIVFVLIILCLIFAIRSYKKNVADEKAANALPLKNDIMLKIVREPVVNEGLRVKKIITKEQHVDGKLLQNAIDNKDILFSAKSDFSHVDGYDPNQYGEIMTGHSQAKSTYYFCIRKTFNIMTILGL